MALTKCYQFLTVFVISVVCCFANTCKECCGGGVYSLPNANATVRLDCTNLNLSLSIESPRRYTYISVKFCYNTQCVDIPDCIDISSEDTCYIPPNMTRDRIDNYNTVNMFDNSNSSCSFTFMPYACASIRILDIETIEVDTNHIVGVVKVPQTPYGDGMDALFPTLSFNINIDNDAPTAFESGRKTQRTVDLQTKRCMLQQSSRKFECNNLSPGIEYEIEVVAWLDSNDKEGSSTKIKVKTKYINECKGINDTETCDKYANCSLSNNDTSHLCQCLDGWTGDGVTCKDTEKPVFRQAPHPIVKTIAFGEQSTQITWQEPNITDNSGNYTVTSNYRSGWSFPIGNTTVTYTATDTTGNTAKVSFYIHVNGRVHRLWLVILLTLTSSLVISLVLLKIYYCVKTLNQKFQHLDITQSRPLTLTKDMKNVIFPIRESEEHDEPLLKPGECKQIGQNPFFFDRELFYTSIPKEPINNPDFQNEFENSLRVCHLTQANRENFVNSANENEMEQEAADETISQCYDNVVKHYPGCERTGGNIISGNDDVVSSRSRCADTGQVVSFIDTISQSDSQKNIDLLRDHVNITQDVLRDHVNITQDVLRDHVNITQDVLRDHVNITQDDYVLHSKFESNTPNKKLQPGYSRLAERSQVLNNNDIEVTTV